MSETHELRLKINAAAARAGAREFVSAIQAIQGAIESLDQRSAAAFTRVHDKAKGTATAFGQLASQYGVARTANERFTTSIAKTNAALQRQLSLAQQARGAMSGMGSTGTAHTSTPSTDAGTRQADQQISIQNRVRRAVDDTRLSVERLTTSLMKVGGFQSINEVSAAYRRFQKEVGGASVSTQKLDSAKTRLNSSLKAAQTSLVTLTAKAQDNVRAEKAAAAATRQRASDTTSAAAATKAAAAAQTTSNSAAERTARAQLSAAQAMRQAEQEAVRLKNRLSALGDTRGITAIDQALIRLRSSMGNINGSSLKARQAMSQFLNTTNQVKVSMAQAEGAARSLATAKRAVAAEARKVESQMRSVAGATNAARTAFRDATGSMRGLENSFSTTYQVGSAFRTMLGSITFGAFIQQVFAAGAALQQFRVTMEVATGSVHGAAEQMDFIDGMARTLGTSLRTTREDFSKFAVASHLAGVNTKTARDIFESVSEAMAVMGRGAADQRLAFLALEQMMSKGTISSEELRRQLGERLPGAVALMARAVGVTTGELQDMLKAGELASAEVLPKFAVEVRKAFGPGLERALQRAPAALGRMRNEFEFFLSAVSDAGFMDALAQGFNDLTRAMQSGDAADAARKLGEGLASLATITLGFAETFITNIDRVATVAKTVIVGLLVRQVLLLGNAIITTSQRSLVGFSTMAAGMQASTVSTAANTTATAANTAARTAGTASLISMKSGYDVLLASQLRGNTATATSTALTSRLGFSMRGLGAAAGATAVKLGAVSTVLVGIAGPLGIAAAALSLIIPMIGSVGNETSNMADQVEGALRRAGIAFEDFHNTAESSTNVELNRITQDLGLLEKSLQTFGKDNAGGILGYRLALKTLNGEIGASDRIGRQSAAAFVHLGATVGSSVKELQSMSSTTQNLMRHLTESALAAAETGTGFTALRNEIQEAMRSSPGARGLLTNLDEFIERAAMAEAAISANRMRLVELYGTSNERALKDFSQLAERVVRTGDGLAELRKSMAELTKESPALAGGLEDIMMRTERAFVNGMGLNQFRALVIDVFDDTVSAIEAAERTSRKASDAAATAAAEFVSASTASLEELSSIGKFNPFVANIESGTMTEIESMVKSYREFGNLAEPLQTVSTIMRDMEFNTEGAQQFTGTLNTQIQTMVNAGATYTEIHTKVKDLNAEYDRFDGSKLVNALAQIKQNADDTIGALEAHRDSLGENEVESRALIDTLIQQVRVHADTESAAYAAEAATYAAAAAAREAGAAGRDGADGMLNLLGAFNSIAGAAAAAAASIDTEIRKVQRQIELRSMKFIDRQVGQAQDRFKGTFEKGRAAIIETFDEKLTEGIRSGMDQGILRQAFGAERDAALADLRAQWDEYESVLREQAITPTNMTGRPTFGGGGRRGGGGRKSSREKEATAKATDRLTKAVESLTKGMNDSLQSLEAENNSLMLLASGYTTSERAARLLGEAQQQGLNIFDEQTIAMLRQMEAAEKLNEALTRLANDPVNDWMNSVPTWREAGQQIETGVLNHLSDAISNFIQTGEFSFEALGDAILGTVADIVADKAVKELTTLLGGNTTGSGEGGFGLGGFMSDLFGNGGSAGDDSDPFAAGFDGDQSASMQNAMVQGGQQAAQAIQTAMMQAGQQVGQQITMGGQQAGAQMGTQVQTAGTVASTQMMSQTMTGGMVAGTSMMTNTQTGGSNAANQIQSSMVQGGSIAASKIGAASAGGGGGGGGGDGGGGGGDMTGILIGAGLSLLGGLLNKNKSKPSCPEEPETPVGIRQYAIGTANTSGIPAILHDNEAVIPLSKGRKVPVELSDETAGRGGSKTVVQNFNITTPDADSFRKSQKQIAADAASSGRKALTDNG